VRGLRSCLSVIATCPRNLELVERKIGLLLCLLPVLHQVRNIPYALFIPDEFYGRSAELKTFDFHVVVEQRKQFRPYEQCLNLSEGTACIELRIFADGGVVNAECEREQAQPHGPQRDIAAKALPQFRFDLWAIVIDVYK